MSGFLVLSDVDRIDIGILIPLTGPQSYFGESELNGYTLALEEYNQNNPKYTIRFHIEDSQANPKIGVDGINKLIFANNIDYAYVTLVPVASPISPIVNEHKVSTFIQVITPHLANDHEYVFQFYQNASDYAREMSNDLLKKNLTNVSLIVFNTDAGIYFLDEFKEYYTGNINTIELFSLDDRDYSTIITKIKYSNSFKSDSIIFMGFPNNNLIFLNDMYKLNYKIPVYLHVANYDNVNQGAKEALKFLEPISLWYTFSKEKSINFVNNYKERFGFYPDAEAAYNYTGMKIMLEAIDVCGKDKECFNQFITSTEFKDHLVSDVITFDENGNSILPVDLIRYDAKKEEWVSYP